MDVYECTKVKEITEVTESSKRAHERLDEHKERMDKLEDSNKILHEMNTNIKIMVQQNQHRDEKIEGIQETVKGVQIDVKNIKEKPQKDFEKYKTVIVTCIITAVTMAFLMSLPTIISNLAK